MFPSTFGMYLVNWLTFKNCSFDQYLNNSTMMNTTQFNFNNTTNFDSLLLSNNMTVSSYVNKCLFFLPSRYEFQFTGDHYIM